MASRAAAAAMGPQQNKGEALVNMPQKKVAGAVNDRKSRRALGDIGNMVTVRGIDAAKPQAQVSRPMTRSFRAQLLANAEAAAAAQNNKKQVIANVDKAAAVVPDAAAAAAAKVQKLKKVNVNPKPVELIKQEKPAVKEEVKAVNKQEKALNTKAEVKGSSKKKAPALTSVLTARSKAACGLANKPKREIVDIDAADASNDLAGVEYVEDIYKFYKLVENESRPSNYIDSQPELNEKMRAILVDWLISVHHKFELSQETLYLTINIVDRFLSVKTVPRRELQLVGIGALLLASKYEEIWAPEVDDLVCVSDGAYPNDKILVMEKTILGKLEWTLTVPTHYVFLARFIKASIPDKDMENMVYYLAELGLVHYDIVIKFSPSTVAASAVYAARCALNKSPFWTDTLKHHTGFSEPQLKDCASLLASLRSAAKENKLQAVYRKYSSPQAGAIALLPPAKNLLAC